MRRRVEALLPLLVLAGFLATAIVVNVLLSDAEDRGVSALEDSVEAQVDAVADGQNQRMRNQVLSVSSFLSEATADVEPYELVVGSAGDLVKLQNLLPEGLDVPGGYYLVDAEGTVTQGDEFIDDPIGQPFDWAGFDALVGAPAFDGGILPMAPGLTTTEPVVGLVLPITDAPGGPVRGYFIYESPVGPETDLSLEIGALRRGETGEYLLFDDRGGVVAATDPSMVGEALDEDRLLSEPVGVHRIADQVVVLADVPAADWRVAFRQDVDEFEAALSRPLDNVGRVLVLVLLAAGFVITVLLSRRLRAARAEQERLRALNEAQQEFVSIVSHELRTPVAGVLGFLETSLDHWDAMDDDERRAAVARAAANARRLQAMTRDVLDTQNLEAGRLVHVFERIDLVAEVRTAVDAVSDLDDERPFEVTGPAEPAWVRGDADRLQQVLANLLDNARKSSPAGEPIEVSVEVSGGEVHVCVADRGAGLDDESLERIFDKFVRGHSDSVSGTGLGLYISRQIVNAHGGRIWAESGPGQGATFRFVVPLSPEEPTTA